MNNFQELNTSDIENQKYSLPVNEDMVKRIANNYNPDVFGYITVCEIEGKYTVIDGHCRLAVAKLMGFEKVPCNVIKVMSKQEEMEHYIRANRTMVSRDQMRKVKELMGSREFQIASR